MAEIDKTGNLFPNFNGFVGLHRYTDFFELGTFGKNDECPVNHDEFGDPIPCDREDFDLSGSSGGSSSGSSGGNSGGSSGGNSGGSSGGGTGLVISLVCDCVGHNSRQIAAGQCRCSTFSLAIIDNSTKKSSVAKGDCDDCPTVPSGSIGINIALYNKIRGHVSTLENIISLTKAEKDFLLFIDNWALTGEIATFWENSDKTQDTKSFIKKSIAALMEGATVDFEDRLINKLTEKAKCIFDKLKTTNGDLFKKTIGEFIDDPQYDLTLRVGDCATTDDACTNATNPKDVTITIENVNQSGLGIGALLLHEAIHAEIHRYVSRFQSGVDSNNRPRLFQLYAYYKGWATSTQDDNYNWRNDAQHQYMVENYVNRIAESVRTLDDNRYPLSHYLAYGWDGLTKYGYTSERLTPSQNSTNQNLRAIANSNSEICK